MTVQVSLCGMLRLIRIDNLRNVGFLVEGFDASATEDF